MHTRPLTLDPCSRGSYLVHRQLAVLIFHAMAIMRGGLFAFIQGKAVERAQAVAVAKAQRLSDKAVNKLEGQNRGADAALAAVTLSAAGERMEDARQEVAAAAAEGEHGAAVDGAAEAAALAEDEPATTLAEEAANLVEEEAGTALEEEAAALAEEQAAALAEEDAAALAHTPADEVEAMFPVYKLLADAQGRQQAWALRTCAQVYLSI